MVSVHPNSMKVGGFYKAALVKEVHFIIPKLKDALNEAKDVIEWVSTLPFPDTKMVSLSHPTEYSVFGDDVITSDG